MNTYEYKGQPVTVKELSEMSGIAPHTLRDRFRRGYTVEQAVKLTPIDESVQQFTEASWYQDWIGLSTSYLYEIYWKWSVSQGYTPIQLKGFTRQLMNIYPNLKTVPTRHKHGCNRVIRER